MREHTNIYMCMMPMKCPQLKQGSFVAITSLTWFLGICSQALMSALHTDTHKHTHIMLRHAPSVCAFCFIQPAARTEFHCGKNAKTKATGYYKHTRKNTNCPDSLVNFDSFSFLFFLRMQQCICLSFINKWAKMKSKELRICFHRGALIWIIPWTFGVFQTQIFSLDVPKGKCTL